MRKRTVLAVLYVCVLILCRPLTSNASTPEKYVGGDPAYYKISLEALQNVVPLTYNSSVRNMIDGYLANQRGRFARVVGLSKYYFPIYEKVFKDNNVPQELKYLSIVESSLNPYALSSAGAAGPWQFLYEMGKLYGLTVNDTIDERRDPAIACKAAARYLLDSYNMYGDWLLAIASYNCGRNNIKWAMEEAPGAKDYWSLRPYLPVETQNYVPAYIATVYIMNNYQRHGIYPIEPDFTTETQTVTVKQPVALDVLAKTANTSLNTICLLNPAYKTLTVKASETKPVNLVLPVMPGYQYNAVCTLLGLPIPKPDVPAQPAVAKTRYVIMYTVQHGDTLESISSKFKDTNEDEIKSVNNLTDTNPLKEGMVIKIRQG